MKADIILKKELLKGNDGGYYVPSMDDRYNLSFTPSNDKMPSVEPYNLQNTMVEGFFDTQDYKNMLAAETARQEAEQSRQAKEIERETAEQTRQDLEIERIEAETARKEAEEERVILTTALITEVEEVIDNAETATKNANDAITALTSVAHANAIRVEENSDVVSITDGAEAPAEIKTFIKPYQIGTPSPDNIHPITGWEGTTLTRCRKNLFDAERIGNIENWMSQDNKVYQSIDLRLPVGNYTLSYKPIATQLNSHICLLAKKPFSSTNPLSSIVNGSGGITTVTQFSFTVEKGEKVYLNWYSNNKNQETLTTLMKTVFTEAQIEQGIIKTDYEPYSGNTCTVDFNKTVYGGEYDWNTGTLTDNWAFMSLTGNETGTDGNGWQLYDLVGEKNRYFYLVVGERYSIIDGQVVSSHFPTNYIASGTIINGVFTVNSSTGTARLVFRPDMTVFTTVKSWTDYLKAQADNGTPIEVAYELNASTITQLEPQQIQTLFGTNSIYSDTGETNVNYIADTKLYIDKKFNELSTALIAMGGN